MLVKYMECDACGEVHAVEIAREETRKVGRSISRVVTKTICHRAEGKVNLFDFADSDHYTKHTGFGFYVVVKKIRRKKNEAKSDMLKLLENRPDVVVKKIPVPVIVSDRKCLVESAMSIRGQFVTIKVFEDATPEKFYEFYYEVGSTPRMIKPRTFGKDKPVHILDIPKVFNSDSQVNTIWHNRSEYEKLLVIDSTTAILERNKQVVNLVFVNK